MTSYRCKRSTLASCVTVASLEEDRQIAQQIGSRSIEAVAALKRMHQPQTQTISARLSESI